MFTFLCVYFKFKYKFENIFLSAYYILELFKGWRAYRGEQADMLPAFREITF